jgi:predicted translin family RNA/ssDNA-binding protein
VSDATCVEKYRLLDEMKKLVREYMLSVQTMTATVGTSEFYAALDKCQKFRAAMQRVKKELNDHATQHRC